MHFVDGHQHDNKIQNSDGFMPNRIFPFDLSHGGDQLFWTPDLTVFLERPNFVELAAEPEHNVVGTLALFYC